MINYTEISCCCCCFMVTRAKATRLSITKFRVSKFIISYILEIKSCIFCNIKDDKQQQQQPKSQTRLLLQLEMGCKTFSIHHYVLACFN